MNVDNGLYIYILFFLPVWSVFCLWLGFWLAWKQKTNQAPIPEIRIRSSEPESSEPNEEKDVEKTPEEEFDELR